MYVFPRSNLFIYLLFLEIPVFHFLNARITFGNINASISPVSGVQSQVTSEPSPEEEETGNKSTVTCSIDMDLFSPPSDYVDRSKVEQHSGGLSFCLPVGKTPYDI